MKSNLKEARLGSILAWGSLLVTVVITDQVSSEPANLGKLLILSAVAFSVTPLLYSSLKGIFAVDKVLSISLCVFLGTSLISVFTSVNPFERGFYGAFGRNNGFLSYFLLAIIFLAATTLRSSEAFKKLLLALLVAGGLNMVVALLAKTGNEIFTWDNPTRAIMGTFGNSNFIGAFMGFFAGLLFVFLLSGLHNKRVSLALISLLILTFVTIVLSKALQGLVVFFIMAWLSLFFYLRVQERFSKFSMAYLFSGLAIGLVAIVGVLNKGPFASLLYKPSVTFRGEYWMAGINMGLTNPLSGVGIDSYGVFYRTYRNESATVFPGFDVTTDAAHNVFIDIFAGTGFLGLMAYALIVGLVLKYAIVYIREKKSFDPMFFGLFFPWLGYQIQSVVSINQLGLAVWGWLLGGAVIGYVRSNLGKKLVPEIDPKMKNRQQETKSVDQNNLLLPASTTLSIFAMFIVGVLIALPPFLADARMRTIMSGQGDSTTLISHVKSFPVDMNRLNRAVITLANSGFNVLAAELAQFGTSHFPNDYASWYSLYELAGPGTPDAEIYRIKLNEIDPFNPKYFEK